MLELTVLRAASTECGAARIFQYAYEARTRYAQVRGRCRASLSVAIFEVKRSFLHFYARQIFEIVNPELRSF